MSKFTIDSINQQVVDIFNSEGFPCEFNKHIRDNLQEILTERISLLISSECLPNIVSYDQIHKALSNY